MADNTNKTTNNKPRVAPDKPVRRRSVANYASSGYSILSILLVLLLLFAVFRALTGGGPYLTFSMLLDALKDAPSIDLSNLTVFNQLHISSDWGLLNFLKDFLNFFVDILSVVGYLGAGLVNLCIYFGYFLRLLVTGIVVGGV